MKNAPFALILRGTNGSGKTSISRKIAEKYKTILIESDMLAFSFQRHKPEGKEHFELGRYMFKCCFDYAVERKRDLVLDGVFIQRNPAINKFSITPYLKILKNNGYSIIRVMLTSSDEDAKKRMEGREYPVPDSVYHEIKDLLTKSTGLEEIIINTSKNTESEVFDLTTKLIEHD